jgi:hypothetical protein
LAAASKEELMDMDKEIKAKTLVVKDLTDEVKEVQKSKKIHLLNLRT